ncbi:hypothetical protein WA026_006189 [Henosepilachna vigintioctopunctata]|uniref:Uncharacterized protein n=1 Tax=Henosepilachna vigintioctopunctata TaxID=420089 RepID=A0AAW1TQQ4_9CUCU
MRVPFNFKAVLQIFAILLLVDCVLSFPQSGDSNSTSEPMNGALSDLEASFGGSTTTAAPETTTARKRTGFYYLLDWNSFLDVDDTKGKHVNLRFQPKIGDPSRFYSVRVP